MIIHRDYRSSSDSVVKIFNDKIEFYNPGKLADEISFEDLITNNYKSLPRNKAIAEFFKNLGWIEKYGSGIGRIMNYFKEAGLPLPTFQNQSGGFLVTVFSGKNEKPTEKPAEKPTEKPTENLSLNQIKIIEFIRDNPRITSVELSILLQIRADSVREIIGKLKKLGYIQRIGPAKGGYWHIINKNE